MRLLQTASSIRQCFMLRCDRGHHVHYSITSPVDTVKLVSSDWNNRPNLNNTTSVRQTQHIPHLSNWKKKREIYKLLKNYCMKNFRRSMTIDPLKFYFPLLFKNWHIQLFLKVSTLEWCICGNVDVTYL